MADGAMRVELTLRLWGTGDEEALEEYIAHLEGLLKRHRGLFERRVSEVEAGPGAADAVLVFSFPNGAAVDGFLRDPLRSDDRTEELATRAVVRSLITDAHHHVEPGADESADIVEIHWPDQPDR